MAEDPDRTLPQRREGQKRERRFVIPTPAELRHPRQVLSRVTPAADKNRSDEAPATQQPDSQALPDSSAEPSSPTLRPVPTPGTLPRPSAPSLAAASVTARAFGASPDGTGRAPATAGDAAGRDRRRASVPAPPNPASDFRELDNPGESDRAPDGMPQDVQDSGQRPADPAADATQSPPEGTDTARDRSGKEGRKGKDPESLGRRLLPNPASLMAAGRGARKVRAPGLRRRLPRVEETSAGGVVLNLATTPAGVALIARHDRKSRLLWSLPKGHVEEGETPEQAALREVHEETGLIGRIVAPLGVIDFWFIVEDKRIHKTVHHFVIEAIGGDLSDEDVEVEAVEWVPFDQVSRRLAYGDERRLVEKVATILPGVR